MQKEYIWISSITVVNKLTTKPEDLKNHIVTFTALKKACKKVIILTYYFNCSVRKLLLTECY